MCITSNAAFLVPFSAPNVCIYASSDGHSCGQFNGCVTYGVAAAPDILQTTFENAKGRPGALKLMNGVLSEWRDAFVPAWIPLIVSEGSRDHPPPCQNTELSTETEIGTGEIITDPVKKLLDMNKVCSLCGRRPLLSFLVFISVDVWVMRPTSSRLGAQFSRALTGSIGPRKWRGVFLSTGFSIKTPGERQHRDEPWDSRRYRANTESQGWKTATAPPNASELSRVPVMLLTFGPYRILSSHAAGA